MRHAKTQKRQTNPDRIYNNILIAKFINKIMQDGKKTVAEGVVYNFLELLKKDGKNPVEVFEKAIQTVGPKQEVKAKRIGGANYQVPIEVRGERRTTLAMRWLIEAARARSNKEFHKFEEKLAAEFEAAINNEGSAIKKRDNAHKMAEANRAFSHFRH